VAPTVGREREDGEAAGERAPAEVARDLSRRLAPLADREQRCRALGRHLARHDPETIAAVLGALLEEADRRTPGADLLVEALISPGLRSTWDDRLATRVMAHARQAGRHDVAGMFLELPELDPRLQVPPPRLPKALEKVPLGVRRAMARRQDIDLLGRLLADPDEAVVANLLGNPRITEREVVAMAARTPVREEVLAAIARHPRWGMLPRVRLTLALNPSTPTGITLAFLRLLLEQDLRAVAAEPRLSTMVRRRAEALLAERRAPPAPTGEGDDEP